MIILDTDFLVNAIKNRVDVDEQIRQEYPLMEIVVLDKTLDELKKVNNIDAKAALKLIELKKFKIIKTNKDKIVDNLIIDIAKEKDIVATQDKDFKRKLKKLGIKFITIKHKDYVSF